MGAETVPTCQRCGHPLFDRKFHDIEEREGGGWAKVWCLISGYGHDGVLRFPNQGDS
jgi:hypothetical protein